MRLVGKVAHLLLVPEDPAIGADDEVAAAALDEVDGEVGEVLLDGGGQTGRAGPVASEHAVFDCELHDYKVAPLLLGCEETPSCALLHFGKFS